MDKLVGLRKYTIRELEPNAKNCMIVCVIINKQKSKKFNTKGTNSLERAVWNFTVRDSPRDYINVACWGSVDSIFALCEKFQVGDIVEIQKPIIDIRKVDDYGEQFHPMVTSPFKLTLNENESEIVLMRDGNFDNLLYVLRLPTKPITSYVTLADIHGNVTSLIGQLVDILVAVRSVGEPRSVKTRFGESQVRNLSVFDYTNAGLNISIWDSEYIARSSIWKPRVTILFMTDMKISYDSFNNCARASISMRSIITEDPICVEADNLRNYAKLAPLEPSAILDQMTRLIPDPITINTVMNIREIHMKINQVSSQPSARPEDYQFTAVVHAIITHFDLDGFNKVVSTRCVRCKLQITNSSNKCENTLCTIGMGIDGQDPETSYDLRLNLCDKTGSLLNCKLSGKYAEELLNCTVERFTEMTDEEKCSLKWRYLLQYCTIRLMVLCIKGRNPLISILTCSPTSLNEILNRA